LAEILEELPNDDYETAHQLCERLLAGGSGTIRQLVGLVGDEFGDAKGVKPKYALHGLVMFASRPGADDQRKLLAETLAAELRADHSPELKAFVCRQLQLCGRKEDVPALGALLADDRLCEPAAQTLLTIGGQAALQAFKRALAGAEGSRKTTISQAVEILSEK
jgi:hypothetical protein